MNFSESKISLEFHNYRQAEMDELLENYLISLANESDIEVSKLTEIYGFRNLKYMIYKFKTEVENIWRENEG